MRLLEVGLEGLQAALPVGEDVHARSQAVDVVDRDVGRFGKVERVAYALCGHSGHALDAGASAYGVSREGCGQVGRVDGLQGFGRAVLGCADDQRSLAAGGRAACEGVGQGRGNGATRW